MVRVGTRMYYMGILTRAMEMWFYQHGIRWDIHRQCYINRDNQYGIILVLEYIDIGVMLLWEDNGRFA